MTGLRERRYTAQDGLSLYYRDYGDPDGRTTPVLCLSGLTRNSKDFDAIASHLCAGRRVICPDYRGRGQSDYDSDPANYRPATYLNDIRHLLAATGIGRAVVVGTSLGGLLAMAMGAAMPTVLAGAVLNDAGPEIGNEGMRRISDYIAADRPQDDWDSAVAELRRMFPDLPLESDNDWHDAARATWRESADGRLRFDWDTRLVDALRNGPPVPDLWPLFRSLDRIPTLAVRGALSDVLSAATFERMAAERSGLRQVTVPRCGHAPTLREPAVRAAIDDFLSGISGPH